MSNHNQWVKFWDEQSKYPTDFAATGRSRMDVPGFLFTVREIARLLQLNADDSLLDIGCGTGIIPLALSPWVRNIHGIDVSENMVKRALDNCEGIESLSFSVGDIIEFRLDTGLFSKILVYSVLQYLPDKESVHKALTNISGVLKPGGKVLLAANPDPLLKDRYIERIYASAKKEDVQRNLELTEQTLWLSREDAVAIADSLGYDAQTLDLDSHIWQHFYMYDLLLTKRE